MWTCGWTVCVYVCVCVSIATPGPGCGKHPQQQYQEERSGVSMLSRAEQWMARRHSRCLQQMYKDPLDTLQTSSTHSSSSLISLCCIFHVFYHLPLYKPFSFSSHAPSPTHLPPFVFFLLLFPTFPLILTPCFPYFPLSKAEPAADLRAAFSGRGAPESTPGAGQQERGRE